MFITIFDIIHSSFIRSIKRELANEADSQTILRRPLVSV